MQRSSGGARRAPAPPLGARADGHGQKPRGARMPKGQARGLVPSTLLDGLNDPQEHGRAIEAAGAARERGHRVGAFRRVRSGRLQARLEAPVAALHGTDVIEPEDPRDRALAHPVAVASQGRDRRRTVGQRLGEEKEVLADAQGGVVAKPRFLDERAGEDGLEVAVVEAPVEQRVGADELGEAERTAARPRRGREHGPDARPVHRTVVHRTVVYQEVVDDHARAGRLGRLDHAASALGPHGVVGVQHRDPAPLRDGEPVVARRAGPAIALAAHEAHAPRRVVDRGRGRAFGRRVVDHHDLDLQPVLRERAVDRVRNGRAGAPCGDDEGHVDGSTREGGSAEGSSLSHPTSSTARARRKGAPGSCPAARPRCPHEARRAAARPWRARAAPG